MARTRLRRIGYALAAVVILEYLVLPQIAGARQALRLLGRVNLPFLLMGVVVEGLAIAAYARLTIAVLPPGEAPRFRDVIRFTLSTLGLSHVVPGGAAAGGPLGYRLLTQAGVPPADAAFALAVQGAGSAVVLNVLLWLGLMVSIPLRGFNAVYLTAAVLGALLLLAFGFAVSLLTRGEERVARITCRVAGRLPFLNGDQLANGLRHVAERLRTLAADRRLLFSAVGWATVNWLLDAASLWIFVAAFGYRLLPDGLIVSFGLANVLAAIPITPGGLGVVEAVLTSSLVGFGAPRGVAILGVVSYRLVNFWLPIPLGAGAYLSLKVGPDAPREARSRELHRLAEEHMAPRPAPPPTPTRSPPRTAPADAGSDTRTRRRNGPRTR